MGQRPNELTPHESLQHYWGAELRALRTHRRMSLVELAQQIHCDPSYLGRIERAERPIPTHIVESCDHALGAHGTLIRLHTLAESERELADSTPPDEDNNPGDVVNQAGSLADKTTVLTVLDTSEEVIVPARTADGRVVFVSVPRRLFLQGLGSAAVGLATTSTPIPSATQLPAVEDIHPIEHFQQMRQVLIENDNLFGPQQVIPVVRDQISIIEQLRSNWRGVDQYKLVRVEAQYTQFYGWLHQDAGEYQLAESWLDRALALAHVAADQDLAAYILARKAHLAGDMHLPADAVGAAEQALRMAPPRSRIAVTAATFAGHGHALSGNQAAMERSYDHACELLSTMDADPTSPCGTGWLDETYIALQRARSTTAVGDYHCATQRFQHAIAKLPSSYRRGSGLWLARAGLAHAGDHEVEHAAALGLDALVIGAETRSAGILTELARLNHALAPWNTMPAVADFRAAMKNTTTHQV